MIQSIKILLSTITILIVTGLILVTALLLIPVKPVSSLQEPQGWLSQLQSEVWVRAGHWHYSQKNYASAANAYRKGFAAIWQDPDHLACFAESLIVSRDGKVSAEAGNALKLLLAHDARHPQGLWMAAVAATQNKDFDEANRLLSALLLQTPPDSDDANHIREQMLKLGRKGGEFTLQFDK